MKLAWKKHKEDIKLRTVNTSGNRNRKPWFTNKVKHLAKEKNAAYLNYVNSKTANEYAYKISRNRRNNDIRQLKMEYWVR